MDINKASKEKRWELRGGIPDAQGEAEIAAISAAVGVSPIAARLLWGRGCRTPEEAKSFLSMGDTLLHDPYLLPGMSEAVERIGRALENPEEHIVIYGDYDVDGVTSVSALYLYLRERNPDVCLEYYIPSRSEEGYGMSCAAVDTLASRGATLIITVDTGITAEDEVDYATSLGIDVIVTDHHECRETLPRALAVIDPHRSDSPYPFCELAGVGVVFKLICACEIDLCRRRGEPEIDGVRRAFRGWADLAAIGTIADVMPLRDENRMIVAYGLTRIERTERPGLAALLEAAQSGQGVKSADGASSAPKKRRINAGYIGFGIAPRINAAGRMADAGIAADLFLTSDSERAAQLAVRLCEINRERQTEENRTAEEAFAKIEAECDPAKDRIIVVADDGWQQGIIGIVASRVVERYGMPAILITFNGAKKQYGSEGDDEPSPDDIGKGSGRSIKGLNLCDALASCSDILTRYGGHELAAGLSVERGRIDELRRRLNEYASACLDGGEIKLAVSADCEVKSDDLTMELAEELRAFEPCGVANPTPAFILRSAAVMRISPIGAGKHTKLTLNADGNVLGAVWFGMPASSLDFHENDRIDLIFNLDINEFRGSSSLQLLVCDARLCAGRREARARQRCRFDEILAGADFDESEDVLPSRQDFARVYRALAHELRSGRDAFTDETAMWLINRGSDGSGREKETICYSKFRAILAVFGEMNIFEVGEPTPGSFRITALPSTGKINLESSRLLSRLRGQCRKHGGAGQS